MKILITAVLFILTLGEIYGQEKQCYCDKDTLMNNATISCVTKVLKSKTKLYWQFNCSRIWLTLENSKGQKFVLDEVSVEFYGYTYRLGFHFVKEFDKSILFRSGCPATGPCIYSLVNKTTGKKIETFGQLICFDNDVIDDKSYQFDFLVYADGNNKNLIVNLPDKNKKLIIPFDFQRNNLTDIIPEYQFESMELKNNLLTLYYTTTKQEKLNLKINLNNTK